MGAALLVYGAYYAFWGITSPWWGPHQALEADQPIGTARAIRFADYPYAEGAKGLILRPPKIVYGWDGTAHSETGDRVVPRSVQSWSGQLGAETGVGVNDGIMRFGLRARLQLPMRIQFDSDWSLLREHDREGVDVVLMGREHLSIRFAESSQIHFYSGLGPQHFCDSRGCVHGVDVTWGLEAFPVRPMLFALEGSLGNLDQAFAPGIRTRVGCLFGPVEASLGWHQRWIDGIPLGGPFAGIAGWF